MTALFWLVTDMGRTDIFISKEPEYSFDRVIIPQRTRDRIMEALNLINYRRKVFDEWGLRVIEPHPSSALNFYGKSGVGKSMAAEAVADMLGKKILRVTYADIESKYQGEGSKNVDTAFEAAGRDNAVLFIDEADSLLSKRLSEVTSGADQSVNALRSQLLTNLDRFEGVVIFATNLVVSYDNAFLTRLISVEFESPDAEARNKIWAVHLRSTETSELKIPLADDVDISELAEKYDFCGREIKRAVISACICSASKNRPCVTQSILTKACEAIVSEGQHLRKANDYTTPDNAINSVVGEIIQKHT